jgi:nicotinamidase-related amidase
MRCVQLTADDLLRLKLRAEIVHDALRARDDAKAGRIV